MFQFTQASAAGYNLSNYQHRPSSWSLTGPRKVQFQPESTAVHLIEQSFDDPWTGNPSKPADLIASKGVITPSAFAQDAWTELNQTGNFLFLCDFHLCAGERNPVDDNEKSTNDNLEVENNLKSALSQIQYLSKTKTQEGKAILNGLVLMGDFMDARSDAYQDPTVFKKYILGILDQIQAAAGNTPIYLSLGNHDLIRANELTCKDGHSIKLERHRLLNPVTKQPQDYEARLARYNQISQALINHIRAYETLPRFHKDNPIIDIHSEPEELKQGLISLERLPNASGHLTKKEILNLNIKKNPSPEELEEFFTTSEELSSAELFERSDLTNTVYDEAFKIELCAEIESRGIIIKTTEPDQVNYIEHKRDDRETVKVELAHEPQYFGPNMQVILGKTAASKRTRSLNNKDGDRAKTIGCVVGDQHVNGTVLSRDGLVFATLPSLGPQATRGAGQEPAFTLWNLNAPKAIPRTYNVHNGRLIIPCFTEYQDPSAEIKKALNSEPRIIDTVNLTD